MAPKKQATFKGKILFLHGYTQSSSIFYAKTSALRKKLLKLNYKSVYLNGPIKLTPADLPSSDSLSKFNSVVSSDSEDTNYRAWWFKPNNPNDGIDLNDSFETIKKYVSKGEIISDDDLEQIESEEEKGLPIAGIVGFSQGAALGGIIAHKFSELFNADPLKFVILYSGFKLDTSKESGNFKYNDYYPLEVKPNGSFRFLHVYGELDTVVDETRALTLYNITKGNSDILKHPGGHFVPNSKLLIDQVTNWLQVVEQGNQEEKQDNDDLNALMDIMDQIDLGQA